MPRCARIIIPHIAHHVVQRGNNRQNILEEPEDFRNYCYWMNQYSRKYQVAILAYCLMNNHVHFVVVPETKDSLSRLFRTVHMRYAQYMNYRKKRSGHLWQGRYFSCVLDDAHLFCAIRYVEQNPVRAKMVQYPWDYEWSSARWHLKKPVKNYIRIEDARIIDQKYWRKYLLNEEQAVDEEIRKRTYGGKALAEENFLTYWEKRLGCVLRPRKAGRKPSE